MRPKFSSTAQRGQQKHANDFLDAMRREGRAPKLDTLLTHVPDDPPDLALVANDRGKFVPARYPLSRKELALATRFPGLRLDYWLCEKRKYVSPHADAPISEWITSLLHTAKSHWSRDVLSRQTALQFRAWLPDYMDRETWFFHFVQRDSKAKWGHAAEVVRLACGLPRLPASKVRGPNR